MRVQKGVTKGLKGHLLQAKRALFASRLVVFINSKCEKLGQKVSSKVRGDKLCHLRLVLKKSDSAALRFLLQT